MRVRQRNRSSRPSRRRKRTEPCDVCGKVELLRFGSRSCLRSGLSRGAAMNASRTIPRRFPIQPMPLARTASTSLVSRWVRPSRSPSTPMIRRKRRSRRAPHSKNSNGSIGCFPTGKRRVISPSSIARRNSHSKFPSHSRAVWSARCTSLRRPMACSIRRWRRSFNSGVTRERRRPYPTPTLSLPRVRRRASHASKLQAPKSVARKRRSRSTLAALGKASVPSLHSRPCAPTVVRVRWWLLPATSPSVSLRAANLVGKSTSKAR